MAFSTQRTVSDGSLALLTIDLDYFDRDEIAVFFDGVLDALPWAWVGSTENKISFTPDVPVGVEVLVRRSTQLDGVLHEFQLGAAFTENSVDENFSQILRIAQEAVEGGSLLDIFNDLDMHGYKIKNVGLAVDPEDVVSFQQFSTHDATIIGYRDAAAASASSAAASAASIVPANLLARANHTGAQAIATVSGLQTALDTVGSDLTTGLAATLASATSADAALISAHTAAADPHTGYMRRVVSAAVSSTSGVSVDFASIPAWATRITIVFSTLTTSGSSIPVFKVGSSGTPVSSGYVGCTSGVSSGASAGNHTDGARLYSTSWTSSYVAHGQITLTLTDPASNLWEYDGVTGLSAPAASAFFGGSISPAGALDIVRLTTQGGSDTFQTGTLRMIYEG